MKTMKSIILLCAAVIVMAGCSKTPEASMTASKSTATINEEITFTSTSKDSEEHQFIAYDGATATGASSLNTVIVGSYDACSSTSITFKFTVAGTYTIELTAKNRTSGDCGQGSYKSDTATITVTIT